jgi:ribonuclease HII
VECVIGGDALCLSIAAASIIAKVTRDRAMQRLHRRFPAYGWHSNAGYGTQEHRAALHLLGPTVHHRAGFGTVRAVLQARLELTLR